MSLTVTDGLILRERKISENDRLITVLTSEHGVIRAFASGALKVTSKRLSATGHLSYSRLTLNFSRDTYKVRDALVNKVFFGLRESIEKYALSCYFCELCEYLAPQDEPAEDFLRLILNSLYLLSESKLPDNIIKSVFELKICQLCGYMPELGACCGCGEDTNSGYFDISAGALYCEKCKKNGEYLLEPLLAAMRHIIYSPDNKIFSFKLGEGNAERLSDIASRFTVTHTENEYKILNFYKSVAFTDTEMI